MPNNNYHYKVIGNTNADDILIFLHGWGGSKESFDKLSNKIIDQEKDLKLILLDLPGFGDAPMPPKEGWNTKDYQQWFESFLSSLTTTSFTKIHLYGHSFGCRVILRHLIKSPKFSGKVFLTGAAGVKWPPTIKERTTKLLNKIFTPIKFILPSKIKKKVLRKLGAGDWAEADPAIKATLQKTLAEEDLRTYFSEIQQDITLIWGKNDTYTPYKSAQVFHKLLPKNTLTTFPEGRHGIHYTHINEISELVILKVMESKRERERLVKKFMYGDQV